MKKWLSKITRSGEIPNRPKGLEDIVALSNNFEAVPAGDEHPNYLIAHGNIVTDRGLTTEIQTAISVRQDEIEFSTNVGQIPDNFLSVAVSERLNHRFDGKFVTFDTEQDKIDLVYATRRPIDLINADNLRNELSNHAKVKVVVEPVLNDLSTYSQLNQHMDYKSVMDVAKEIVDNGINLQRNLADLSDPLKYLQPPEGDREK